MKELIYAPGRREADVVDISLYYRPDSGGLPLVRVRYRAPHSLDTYTYESGPFTRAQMVEVLSDAALGLMALEEQVRGVLADHGAAFVCEVHHHANENLAPNHVCYAVFAQHHVPYARPRGVSGGLPPTPHCHRHLVARWWIQPYRLQQAPTVRSTVHTNPH